MRLENMNCLVLMGAAGAGKDTVAKYVEEYLYGTKAPRSGRLRFSAPLKHVVATMFGLDEERLNDLEYKESLLERQISVPEIEYDYEDIPCVVNRLILTPRELLQWFGTDFGRRIDPDIWVKAAIRQAEIEAPWREFFISTDCRFPNEQEAIKKAFGRTFFVRLERTNREILTGSAAAHASENQDLHFDRKFWIPDGDLEGLRWAARIIAEDVLNGQ